MRGELVALSVLTSALLGVERSDSRPALDLWRMSDRYPCDRRLGGYQILSVYCRVQEYLLSLPEIECLPPSPRPNPMSTEASRFLLPHVRI
jgi:hypothetical protein